WPNSSSSTPTLWRRPIPNCRAKASSKRGRERAFLSRRAVRSFRTPSASGASTKRSTRSSAKRHSWASSPMKFARGWNGALSSFNRHIWRARTPAPQEIRQKRSRPHERTGDPHAEADALLRKQARGSRVGLGSAEGLDLRLPRPQRVGEDDDTA